MNSKNMNIVIVEPSLIIFEGLSAILSNYHKNININQLQSFEQISTFICKNEIDFIFANPSEIQNRLKELNSLKKNFSQTKWIGIIYSLFDKNTLSHFDEIIYITDYQPEIIEKISKLNNLDKSENHTTENLSEREIVVLVQLVNGLSNKEIAEKLNISIHTVISHRKNITQKTGIKSQSGLTIYAISNKIISLDNIS